MAHRSPIATLWTIARFASLTFLATLFLWIAFYAGPNYFRFGKLTAPTPADFREDVLTTARPILIAVRQYHANHGQYPDGFHSFWFARPDAVVRDHTLLVSARHRAVLSYDLASDNALWHVKARYTAGPVPGLPPEPPTTTRSSP